MVTEVELGVRLLTYAALLLAVPLSFVLLFRAIDYVAVDGLSETYADAMAEEYPVETAMGDGDDERDDGTGPSDGVACPQCGAHNDPEFTFCRSCQAQFGI